MPQAGVALGLIAVASSMVPDLSLIHILQALGADKKINSEADKRT